MTEAVAKGARKSGSRLSGISEPLTHNLLQIATGKRMNYVTQGQPLTAFRRLREDYERLSLGFALAELFIACNPEGQISKDAFELLLKSLRSLDSNDDPKPAFAWSSLRLLELEGILPTWLQCAVTQQRIEENPAMVSPAAGGYVGSQSAFQFRDRFSVSAETLIGLAKLRELADPPTRLKEADSAIRTLYAFWVAAAHKPLPAFAAALPNSKLTS